MPSFHVRICREDLVVSMARMVVERGQVTYSPVYSGFSMITLSAVAMPKISCTLKQRLSLGRVREFSTYFIVSTISVLGRSVAAVA